MIRPIRNATIASSAVIVLNRDDQASRAVQASCPAAPLDFAEAQAAPTSRAMPARYRALRPDAAFVTQLIATAQGLPQTCARRRASFPEAAKAYGAASTALTGRLNPLAA